MALVVHNAWLQHVSIQRRRMAVPAAAASTDGESTCSGSDLSKGSSSGDEWEENDSLPRPSARSPVAKPFYIGPPGLIDDQHRRGLRQEHEPETGLRGQPSARRAATGQPPARGVATVSEAAAAALPATVRHADADARGRMILRYGRYVRNATRHITLLRGGINKQTELLWKDVSQRITRDADSGELISWDVDCQRMSKAKLYRDIPGGPRNIHVTFVPSWKNVDSLATMTTSRRCPCARQRKLTISP